jgi:hypothetical protein
MVPAHSTARFLNTPTPIESIKINTNERVIEITMKMFGGNLIEMNTRFPGRG